MPPSVAHPQVNSPQKNEEFVNTKPVNVFYVWYAELCRRQATTPLSYVKPPKPKNDCVLDFNCDRIKPEEWGPILNALKLDTSLHVIAIRTRTKCTFLHDINTEDKVKTMKRRLGSIFTTYFLQGLMKSLTNCIRRTEALACLELDGIPLGVDEIVCLVGALKPNTSIKVLILKYCPIRDLGCQILCEALRQMPNIEVLDLSGCGLGAISAQNIAKIVKYQQINRYCESWHNSLRYEDPEVGIMAGLKRITLKNNPHIGDEGLTYILDELDDDLWIKAIDMQRCGITEKISKRLLDVIEYSRSLEVADFRCNEQLSPRTLNQIIQLIKQKHGMGFDCEYKWGLTTTTLREGFSEITASSSALCQAPIKSKSEPLASNKPPLEVVLKRNKTCTSFGSRRFAQSMANSKGSDNLTIRKSILCLNTELQKETNKRLQSEIENRRLKHELHRIKSSCSFNNITNVENNVSKEKVIKFDANRFAKKRNRKTSSKKCNKNDSKEKLQVPKINCDTPSDFSKKTKRIYDCKNKTEQSNCRNHNSSNVEFVFETKDLAQNILDRIVNQSNESGSENSDATNEDDEEDKLMVDYFEDVLYDNHENVKCSIEREEQEDDDDESTASLLDFMREIKSSKDVTGEVAARNSTNKIWGRGNFLQKVH